jgi:hypothetical protein
MIRTLATALTLALALPAFAEDAPPQMTPEQQAMMQAYIAAGTPGKQHAKLASSVGNYSIAVRSWDTPDAAPRDETGTATRSMILDGRVMVERMQSKMGGQPFTGHGMTGYDNVSGKWWATWNDSMSTGIMLSEGDCDADGDCTFHGSWNDPVTKARVKARFTTHWTSPTTERFEMYGPGPDGKEYKMMEMTYTKQ